MKRPTPPPEARSIATHKLHWIDLAIQAVPVAVAASVIALSGAGALLAAAVLMLPIWFLLRAVTSYFTTTINLNKYSLTITTGLIWRETIDIPISRIETIELRQSLLARSLNYGSLVVSAIGGGVFRTSSVKAPGDLRQQIYQAMSLSIG